MKVDPKGPNEGEFRVFRSGSWNSFALYCRVAYRSDLGAAGTSCILGFRVAFSVPARKSRDERKP